MHPINYSIIWFYNQELPWIAAKYQSGFDICIV
jgi:hypothetical protein